MTSTTTCLVSAVDYARYWEGKGEILPEAWSLAERRIGLSDRRAQGVHDRRWDAAQGRRRYAGSHDRRRGTR